MNEQTQQVKVLNLLNSIDINCIEIDEFKKILRECDKYLLYFVNEYQENKNDICLDKTIEILKTKRNGKELGEILIHDAFIKNEILTPSLLAYDFDSLRKYMKLPNEKYKRLNFRSIFGCGECTKSDIIINYAENVQGREMTDYTTLQKNFHMLFVIRHELGHAIRKSILPNTTNPEEQLILNDEQIQHRDGLNYIMVHSHIPSEHFCNVKGETETLRDAKNKYYLPETLTSEYEKESKDKLKQEYDTLQGPRKKYKKLVFEIGNSQDTKELFKREDKLIKKIGKKDICKFNPLQLGLSVTSKEYKMYEAMLYDNSVDLSIKNVSFFDKIRRLFQKKTREVKQETIPNKKEVVPKVENINGIIEKTALENLQIHDNHLEVQERGINQDESRTS